MTFRHVPFLVVLTVILLAAMSSQNISSTASAGVFTPLPRESIRIPKPSPTQTEAPAPAPSPTEEVVETPAAEEGSPSPEASPTASSEPDPEPIQTAPPAINPEVSDCQRGQATLIENDPPVLRQIGIEKAWTVSTGDQIVVAVVDSGVDATNPHFEGAMVPGIDLLGGGDGTVDEDGHGTAVAGVIAARPVEGSKLVGIAKNSLIMPVRVYAGVSEQIIKEGRGPVARRTAEGIRWAAENGAKVIVVAQAQSENDPILESAVKDATAMGALVIAGAGTPKEDEYTAPDVSEEPTPTSARTEGAQDEPRYPAGHNEVLGVTALDANGIASASVNRGPHVDISVPAQAVPTTFFDEGDCVVSQGNPSPSLAAGYGAGVVALVVAAYPHESPAEWKYRITATGLRPIPYEASPTTGWGMIAPYAALNFVNDGTALGPENPRGAVSVATPSPVAAMPPGRDLDAERRARFAKYFGGAGAVMLVLSLLVGRLRLSYIRRG